MPSESVSPAEIIAAGRAVGSAIRLQQAELLAAYLELLSRWNAVYNLTAVRAPREMATQHLYDCLAVVAPLSRQLGSDVSASVLDVGSGGGLPGVVLAIANRAWDVCCVDAVRKKASFITQVAAELAIPNLRSVHSRVEHIGAGSFDLITSRAFGTLALLTTLTMPLLRADGVWMAMKGKVPHEEIAALPPDVAVFHVEHLQVPGLSERCLVWMRAL